MTERVELTALYPQMPDERVDKWSDRVLSHAKEAGTNRQCSIGWHEECSDPDGERCQCLCHADGFSVWSVEGHRESGKPEVIRAEEGEHRWPPQPGEPETMWGHYILAESEEDARNRAIAKESRVRSIDNSPER